jgi:hypothetical protein
LLTLFLVGLLAASTTAPPFAGKESLGWAVDEETGVVYLGYFS